MDTTIAAPGYNNPKRLNIFYFSDYHGNIPAYRHLKTASDEFDKKNKNSDTLKLSGGDLAAGNDPEKRVLLYRLIKKMKMDASAVGNHEWDNGLDFFKEYEKLVQKAPNLLFKDFISCNTQAPDNKKYKDEGLFQSKIISKNNEKYGVIGTTTFDNYQFEHCKMDDLQQTEQDITNEIQNLKKKDPSLNKFILLSHLGIDADKKIAQEVPDVDIIIGGHSHTQINGVTPNKNLFMTPKNEPVLIVQAGNEKNYGELSVAFDKEGKLDLSKGNEPVNINKSVYNYGENPEVKEDEDKILKPSPQIGILNKTIRPDNPLLEENPIGSLNADALLKSTKTDVAILNAGGFRSSIEAGKIDERNIEYCVPFSNNVVTIKCTGKQIADVINLGVESTKYEHANPGLYQVAGLKYTVSKDKTLKNLYTVDENGRKKIDIINSQGNLTPEGANTKFTVALTDFMITNGAKKGLLTDFTKTENDIIKVDDTKILNKFGKQRDILINYLKSEFGNKNKPIDVDSGRIIFEKDNKPADISFHSLIKGYTQQI